VIRGDAPTASGPLARAWLWLGGFWGRRELQVLGLNLAVHALVQAAALQFMPLASFSRLSLHDGNTYYRIAQNLWSAQPVEQYTWHKRILHVLLGRFLIPWNMELSFLAAGILAASLSAVYFYRIAARHVEHPFKLTLLYSALPWLFFPAHHALNEPLLMLTLLAGYYYYTEGRLGACTVSYALALLTKELAAFPALAVGLLILRRWGWRKALLFATAVLPMGVYCLAYGLRWGDCAWCLKTGEAPGSESFFSVRTGFYWMVRTLLQGTNSSANPTVALAYDIGNQALNLLLIVFSATALVLLWRRRWYDLAFVNTLPFLPLLFLGETQYNLNSSVGRKYLLLATAMLAYDRWAGGETRGRKIGYGVVMGGMLALGILWTFLYSKFFVYYKFF